MRRIILLTLFALLLAQTAAASTCGDYSLSQEGSGSCSEFTLKVDYGGIGFGSVDATSTLSLPYGTALKPGSTIAVTSPVYDGGSTLGPQRWSLTCNQSGNYTFNVSITDNAGTTNCLKILPNKNLVLAEPLLVEHVIVDLPHIPALTLGENYSFNISVSNTGNKSAYNLTLSINDSQEPPQFTFYETSTNYSEVPANSSINWTVEVTPVSSSINNILRVTYSYNNSGGNTINQSNSFTVVNRPTINTDNIDFASSPLNTNQHSSKSISYLLSGSSCSEGICIIDKDIADNSSSFNISIQANNTNITLSYNNTLLNISVNNSWTGVANISITANDTYNLSAENWFTLYIQSGAGEGNTCDQIDNDGDSFIDEGINCNTGNNHGETKASETTTNSEQIGGEFIAATIKKPQESEHFQVGSTVQFLAKTESKILKYLWTFQDGSTTEGSQAEKTYEEVGTYKIGLDITYTDDSGKEKNSKTSHKFYIDECMQDSDCTGAEELCCNYECRKARCTENEECNDPENPYLTSYSCATFAGASCQNICEIEECEIGCTSNNDCDNPPNEYTQGTCTGIGTCTAACEYDETEKKILINEPIPNDLYETRDIWIDFEINFQGTCAYDFNGGNSRKLEQSKSHSFGSLAPWGSNTLHITCHDDINNEDYSNSVHFAVGEENINPEILKNLAGEAGKENIQTQHQNIIPAVQVIERVFDEANQRKGLGVKKALGKRDAHNSEIVVFVKNNKPLTATNIKVTENIPKEYAESATQITSTAPLEIIEDDPIIRFSIESILPGEEIKVIYTIPKQLTQEELTNILTELKSENHSEEELQELYDQQQNTQDNIKIEQIKKADENKTTYENTIKPKKVMKDVDVYLNIPKCMAEKVNDIHFQDQDFDIIAEDPLIVWHFAEVNENIDLHYSLEGLVDEDCENQAAIVAVARLIEDQYVKGNDTRKWNIIIPLLFIPIIILIILLMYHFTQHKTNYYFGSFNPIGAAPGAPNTSKTGVASLFPSLNIPIEPPEKISARESYPYDDKKVTEYPKP